MNVETQTLYSLSKVTQHMEITNSKAIL